MFDLQGILCDAPDCSGIAVVRLRDRQCDRHRPQNPTPDLPFSRLSLPFLAAFTQLRSACSTSPKWRTTDAIACPPGSSSYPQIDGRRNFREPRCLECPPHLGRIGSGYDLAAQARNMRQLPSELRRIKVVGTAWFPEDNREIH